MSEEQVDQTEQTEQVEKVEKSEKKESKPWRKYIVIALVAYFLPTILLIGAGRYFWARVLAQPSFHTLSVKEMPHGLRRYHPSTIMTIRPPYQATTTAAPEKFVFVLNFHGSGRPGEAYHFRQFVDEAVLNSSLASEIVVRINSPGGLVTTYGYLKNQMERLLATEVPLTVCIDGMAASGGYMMALPAHKIIASEYSVVGSVGIISVVPNLNEALEKLGIRVDVHTSGEHKAPVNFFTKDPDSPELQKYMDQRLEALHEQFVADVARYRGDKADLDWVRKAGHCSAKTSIDKGYGLVDELGTSPAYLQAKNRNESILYFSRKLPREELLVKLFGEASQTVVREAFDAVIDAQLNTPVSAR